MVYAELAEWRDCPAGLALSKQAWQNKKKHENEQLKHRDSRDMWLVYSSTHLGNRGKSWSFNMDFCLHLRVTVFTKHWTGVDQWQWLSQQSKYNNLVIVNNKAKQPESGDLCDNITEFGVAEGSPSPCRLRWSFRHPNSQQAFYHV